MRGFPRFRPYTTAIGICVGIMRDMARRLKGTRADDFEGVYRSKRANIIGAMSLKTVISVTPVAQSCNGEQFQEFLRDE